MCTLGSQDWVSWPAALQHDINVVESTEIKAELHAASDFVHDEKSDSFCQVE